MEIIKIFVTIPNTTNSFHSDWPLESAFIQADDDDGGGLDDDDDGELRSRDELLHQILRDQVLIETLQIQ